MKKAFNITAIVCSFINGASDVIHWIYGDPATGWTWFFAVLFSVGVMLTCTRELIDKDVTQ